MDSFIRKNKTRIVHHFGTASNAPEKDIVAIRDFSLCHKGLYRLQLKKGTSLEAIQSNG